MAYGRPANVRSHRRGGTRRRPRVAPWISVTLVSLLVLAGVSFGYQQLLSRACSGEATAIIAASPSTAPLLDRLATRWSASEHSTEGGACARVVIDSRESAEVATLLTDGWDNGDDQPDVWIPAASIWAQKAAASDLAEPLLPDLRPSIARSPTVIAMPEPMAAELDWPDPQLDSGAEVQWESLLAEFIDYDEGWAKFDRPEWGEFRFGMTNPTRSTAGLLALTAILDSNDDGEASLEELENSFRLKQLMDPEIYHETTEQLLLSLTETSNHGGTEAALHYVSAFPALEQEVFNYNQANPAVPLAAIYPTNGNVEADHPYLILEAEWVTDEDRAVAEAFLTYLRSPEAQAELRKAGFRGTNREPGEDFTPHNGLVSELVALPRTLLMPESVTRAVDHWTAITRSTNMLLVLDVSSSMLQEIPGAGETRLDRAKHAAAATVELFPDDGSIGFWEFSTALDGDLDYRPLVPMGPLADVMEDNRSRREHVLEAIGGLTAHADTGLYNTIAAAYDTVLANYDEHATNMVVIITDGEDDTSGRPGISLDELLDHLRTTPADGQQVQVVSIPFGEEADPTAMETVSDLTGGRTYYSEEGFELADLLRTAVFGGVS